MQPTVIPLGRRYGRLIVIKQASSSHVGKTCFACSCDCGKITTVLGQSLRRGYTTSCGCWRIEAAKRFTTHGEGRTVEYGTWARMKDRCYNPNNPFFARYGGRGITVCDTWKSDYPAFLRDVGRKPGAGYSLDRFPDKDGDYRPGNVRWATNREQAENRATVEFHVFDDISDTVAGWARRTGIPYLKLRRRLRDGWTLARALERETAL